MCPVLLLLSRKSYTSRKTSVCFQMREFFATIVRAESGKVVTMKDSHSKISVLKSLVS